MTQPSLPLELSTERREKKRGHVPRTSVAAYEATDASGRMASVLEWLRGCTQWEQAPTSAELASWRWRRVYAGGSASTDCLLYVRRGLSDARAAGLVEHVPHGERTCRVTGRKSVCWRVRGR